MIGKIKEVIKENENIKVYIIIIALAFIICGPFFRTHLATDSYNMVNFSANYIFDSSSGRPISDIFLMYTRVIGFDMMEHQQFYLFISIVIMTYSTILLYDTCRKLVDNKKSLWITGIASLLIIFNIFGFEMYLFNVMFSLSIQYLLIVYSVRLLLKELNFKNVVIAILLNLIGLCIYQGISPIFLGISIILFGYKYKEEKYINNIKNYTVVGLVYGISCILNMVLIKMVSSGNRYENSSIKQNILKLIERQGLLWKDTFGFFPKNTFLNICIILFVISMILLIIYNRKKFTKLAFSLVLAIGTIIFAAYIPHIISPVWIEPRATQTISAIPGLILLFIGINFIDLHYIWKIIILSICCIYLILSINTTIILVDKLVKTNEYDKQISNKIVTLVNKYEKETGNEVKNMAFTFDKNPSWQYYQIGDFIKGVDVYVKAFSTTWSRTQIFKYYYDRSFTDVEMPGEIYEQYFKDKDWNDYDDSQVVIIDDTAYIAVF